jgi:hypothetical protein
MDPSARAIEPAAGFGVSADDAQIDVVADRHVQKQALRLAVLGQVHHAAIDRLGRRTVVNDLALQFHRSRCAWLGAIDQAREFGAACANEPREAENFAGTQREAAALHPPPVAEIGHLEHRCALAAGTMFFLVKRRQVAPDHHADNTCGADLVAAKGADIEAVAQYRYAAGELVNLRHAVGDVDNGKTFRLQTQDQLEQPLSLPV